MTAIYTATEWTWIRRRAIADGCIASDFDTARRGGWVPALDWRERQEMDRAIAETRGQTRRRLVRYAIRELRDGADWQEVHHVILNDADAERHHPDPEARGEWARGIINWAEWSTGIYRPA